MNFLHGIEMEYSLLSASQFLVIVLNPFLDWPFSVNLNFYSLSLAQRHQFLNLGPPSLYPLSPPTKPLTIWGSGWDRWMHVGRTQ